jgi:hypothetical protein
MGIIKNVLDEINNPHSHATRTSRRMYVDSVAHYLSTYGVARNTLSEQMGLAAYLVKAFEAEMEPKACAIAIVKMIKSKEKR